MPMPKKANGANFGLSGGDITVRFEADEPVIYVVCLWGAKPEFGGQRQLLWRSEELNSRNDGDTITLPPELAMAGMQITWSGGLISSREGEGGMRVTVAQRDGATETYSYEYHFGGRNEAESFYDGLNLK
jgi:hypothetical protein